MNKSERNFGSKYVDITPHMSVYPYVLSIANTVPGDFIFLGTIKSSQSYCYPGGSYSFFNFI